MRLIDLARFDEDG